MVIKQPKMCTKAIRVNEEREKGKRVGLQCPKKLMITLKQIWSPKFGGV